MKIEVLDEAHYDKSLIFVQKSILNIFEFLHQNLKIF